MSTLCVLKCFCHYNTYFMVYYDMQLYDMFISQQLFIPLANSGSKWLLFNQASFFNTEMTHASSKSQEDDVQEASLLKINLFLSFRLHPSRNYKSELARCVNKIRLDCISSLLQMKMSVQKQICVVITLSVWTHLEVTTACATKDFIQTLRTSQQDQMDSV